MSQVSKNHELINDFNNFNSYLLTQELGVQKTEIKKLFSDVFLDIAHEKDLDLGFKFIEEQFDLRAIEKKDYKSVIELYEKEFEFFEKTILNNNKISELFKISLLKEFELNLSGTEFCGNVSLRLKQEEYNKYKERFESNFENVAIRMVSVYNKSKLLFDPPKLAKAQIEHILTSHFYSLDLRYLVLLTLSGNEQRKYSDLIKTFGNKESLITRRSFHFSAYVFYAKELKVFDHLRHEKLSSKISILKSNKQTFELLSETFSEHAETIRSSLRVILDHSYQK